jgi:N-ethylmaleimide reductase
VASRPRGPFAAERWLAAGVEQRSRHRWQPQGEQNYEIPRRLLQDEMPAIVAQFKAAAERAIAAGFDGVQLHGAHGYLLDQFLRDGLNDRNDDYGGTLPKRARLLLETVDAAIAVLGAGRVSVRISPLVGFNDMQDSAPEELVAYLSQELSRRQIAFLELRHNDHRLPAEQRIAQVARAQFQGALFANGSFDQLSAEAAIASQQLDAVVFGRAFIANPDLVERFQQHAPLNEMDASTLYTPGAKGYTDYPAMGSGRTKST